MWQLIYSNYYLTDISLSLSIYLFLFPFLSDARADVQAASDVPASTYM